MLHEILHVLFLFNSYSKIGKTMLRLEENVYFTLSLFVKWMWTNFKISKWGDSNLILTIIRTNHVFYLRIRFAMNFRHQRLKTSEDFT